jgi:glutaconate CoA-transferase subunit A
MQTHCSLQALAEALPEGARVAIAENHCGVAMAATRELIRCGARGLRLVCVPVSGLQAELLIGAGCVASIETAGVTLDEFGSAHRFVAALKAGTIRVIDSTCPAIHAGLQASQKGIPFIPLRGLIGSDVLAHRPDWMIIDNPFAPGDRIAALPAIRPDVALFHAPLADREGNVYIGTRRELLTMAHASAQTFVSVEEVVEARLLDDPLRAAGTIPAIYISRIATARRGAWPLSLPGVYAEDGAELARYASLAASAEGFARYLEEYMRREPLAA